MEDQGKRRFNTAVPSGEQIVLSFVIPTKNEEAIIGKSLAAITALEFPSSQIEVIVVDNGSTDKTVSTAESYATNLQLRTVMQPTGYVSAVRNAGAGLARGNVIVFLDADCIVSKHWARHVMELLQDTMLGAVGGPVLPESTNWIAQSWFENDVLSGPRVVDYLGTAALAMRKEVFQLIGGFDEALESNEDYELCLRTRRAGFVIKDFPQLAVTHLRTPETIGQFFRRERWHGTHVFRVFVENISALANIRAVAFALFSFGCFAGFVSGVYLAIAKSTVTLLVTSAVLYLVSCLALAWRMLRKHRCGLSLRLLLGLVVLHLLYGAARASALLRVRTWVRSRSAPGSKKIRIAQS